MLARFLETVRLARDLGRAYWASRDPHIEARLPDDHPPGSWVVLATKERVGEGPVYATAALRAVEPGARFWVFVEEGEYWLYALRAPDPAAGLRTFYAEPKSAVLLSEERTASVRGFRGEK